MLLGQVKQYFAYESQNQHAVIDETGGFKHFCFYPYLQTMIQFDKKSTGLKPPPRYPAMSKVSMEKHSHLELLMK